MPDRVMVKFKAADTWILNRNVSTGAQALYKFRPNDPYDPVEFMSTTKCTGFDDMMKMYTYGIAFGFKIKVRPLIATACPETIVYIQFARSTSTQADSILNVNQICEGKMTARWKILYSTSLIQSIGSVKPLQAYCDIKRIETASFLDRDKYRFTADTSPQYRPKCSVGIVSANTGADFDFTSRLFVQMTYYCMLYDREKMTE